MKKSILILAIVSFLTFSCSNDDDNSTPEPTTEELLVSGKWYFRSINDVTSNTCEQQSYFHFTDATSLIVESFSINSSTSVCQSAGLIGYTYSVNSNNQIVVTRNSEVVVYEIDNISASNLVLRRQLPSGTQIIITLSK